MAPWWAWSHASPSSGWSERAPRLAILPAIEPIPSRCCHIGSAVADEKAEVRRQTNSRQQFVGAVISSGARNLSEGSLGSRLRQGTHSGGDCRGLCSAAL